MEHDWRTANTWRLVLATGVLITCLHWFLLLVVLNRWTAKPLLFLLALLTSAAIYFMATYSVYLDKSMLRNVLETDLKEASELFDWKMVPYFIFFGVLPIFLVWRVRLRQPRLTEAVIWRASSMILALTVGGAALWASAFELFPTMREHKELRYLVTPSNYILSLARLLSNQTQLATHARMPIAVDAHRPALPAGRRPVAFVIVVGETVRAANWGLGAYRRQTTPELAKRGVINFADVTSCGTDTATSLPCMFSVYGRRNYDEERIRSSESVLHVLHRAGVSVLWRDNQSGCKGVCDGLPVEYASDMEDAARCVLGRCFDGVLIDRLKEKIDAARGDILIVLHMLGNHGPAYYQRYPAAFRRWQPTCDTTRLASCSREALVNTYDNAIHYTDHVLAQAIDILASISSHDTGLLYVSDHGESLGEHGLYLHGVPYRIAPDEQTKVPMIIWLSSSLMTSAGLDASCLAKRAAAPASHDNLAHTTLGLFGVRSKAYEPAFDVMAACHQSG
jgi:lipid A ethanolaminephosphotransferase